jgi:hypothetical protein
MLRGTSRRTDGGRAGGTGQDGGLSCQAVTEPAQAAALFVKLTSTTTELSFA